MDTVDLLLDDILWVVRRLPKNLREYMVNNRQGKLFLAGGFVRDCIANNPPSDIDLFVPSKDAATAAMLEISKAMSIDPLKAIETCNAFTIPCKPLSIQIIHRWTFDTADEAIASFDYTIAQAAVWFEDGYWRGIASERFYADLAARRLVYTSPIRQEEPGGSFLRMLKLYQRGYRITLESAGALVARLVRGVNMDTQGDEQRFGKIVTGLLREVDPNVTIEVGSVAWFAAREIGDEAAADGPREDE